MNRNKALALIDIIMSEGSTLVEKRRAAAQLKELICILLPETEKEP